MKKIICKKINLKLLRKKETWNEKVYDSLKRLILGRKTIIVLKLI